MNNEIKITGRIYKLEKRNTSTGKIVNSFVLRFYNGKDKEGKSQYAFITCKSFFDVPYEEKTEVNVSGFLGCNEWTDRQGQTRKDLQIIVNNLSVAKVQQPKQEIEIEEDSVDNLPF